MINANKYFEELRELANKPEGFRAHSYLIVIYAIKGEDEKAFGYFRWGN